MEDDSLYNMSQSRGYSVPPPLPMTCNAEPSELYQVRISLYHISAVEKPDCSDIFQVKHSNLCATIHHLNIQFVTLSQIVLRHSHHPPILQPNSWNIAVPFKEQHYHRTPSESIGNNYSPRAKDLKIIKLQQRRHTLRQSLAKPAGLCILSSSTHISPWSVWLRESYLKLSEIAMLFTLFFHNIFLCEHLQLLQKPLRIDFWS